MRRLPYHGSGLQISLPTNFHFRAKKTAFHVIGKMVYEYVFKVARAAVRYNARHLGELTVSEEEERFMGSRILEFQTTNEKNAKTFLVEIDDPMQTGNVAISRQTAERARQSLESALEELRPGVDAMMTKLHDLASQPDEVSLAFGIKFTAEANALIAKTAVEGNVTVKLKWAKSIT
jgi:hypothetical protein